MEIAISLVLLFVGIAILVLIHVCIVGRAFRRESEGGNQIQRGGIGTKRMCSEDLKRLPSFDYKEVEKEASMVECAVCLENFKVGELCRLLPSCNHSFHVHCIDPWLVKTPICPICRTWVNSRLIPTVVGRESTVSDDAGIEMV